MTLPNWSLLGAILAVLIGFVVYAAWSIDAKNADQVSLGRYAPPKLEEAQAEQQQRSTPTSTANSSSTAEAHDQTPSTESAPPAPISLDPVDPPVGQAVLTETPPLGDMIAKTTFLPLADQPTGISTPIEDCASEVSCADPPPQIPNQNNAADRPAPSCAGNHGKAPCTDKKAKKGKNKS